MKGNKRILGIYNGQVVDAQELQTGMLPEDMEVGQVIDLGVQDFVGLIVVKDITSGDSAFIQCHTEAGIPVLGDLVGSSNISKAKDTAAKVNVFVDADTLQVQNNLTTPAQIQIELN